MSISPLCEGVPAGRVTSIASTRLVRRVRVTEDAGEFVDKDSREFDRGAAAVSAVAQGTAESSRDVSDPTSGAGT